MAKATFPETTGQESSKPISTSSSQDMKNVLSALFQGDLSPLRPRAQDTPNMTIKVNPIQINSFFNQVWLGASVPLTYAGGNSPTVTAPTTNPRIDLLTIDNNGTLAWTVGSEAASPTPPNCPANKMPICYIYCKTTMDRILNYEDKDTDTTEGYIYQDVRPFLNLGGDGKVKASSGDTSPDYLDGKVDNFTIEVSGNKIRVVPRIELNIMLLAFLRAIDQSASKYNLIDGIIDEFEDETGVDTAASVNESYNAVDDFYSVATPPSVITGGTPSAESIYSGTYSADKACDNNDGTWWLSNDVPDWWKYDLGVGVTKTVVKLEFTSHAVGYSPNAFTLQGSNNDVDWTTIYTGNGADTPNLQTFIFSNSTAYRYYRVNITTCYGGNISIKEFDMYEAANMTLISNAITAVAEPTQVRVVLFEEDVDVVTINTDIKAWVSIDGGSNYDQVTLSDEGNWASGKRVLSGIVDVTARTGTSIKWKVTTHNNKNLKLHAVGLNWN